MRDAFAGALGSTFMVLITQPIDTCKVNLQQCSSMKGQSMARALTQSGGAGVLWAGTLPALYLYVTEHAILFGAWSCFVRTWWPQSEIKPHTVAPIWLGLSCGLCCTLSSMLTCPADFLKCRLQVNPGVFHGVADCFVETVRTEGTRALFQNYRSVLLRDALFFSGYVTSHETLCRWWLQRTNRQTKAELKFEELFVLGGTAGTAGWLLASPADVINSRRQARLGGPSSMMLEMQQIARHEGTRALWTGMRYQVMRGFIGYGTFTVGYTMAINMWQGLQDSLPLPVEISLCDSEE